LELAHPVDEAWTWSIEEVLWQERKGVSLHCSEFGPTWTVPDVFSVENFISTAPMENHEIRISHPKRID
jgi:hypothetical protein